jgi:glycosyltransferase involved in cell wall biosynthesis
MWIQLKQQLRRKKNVGLLSFWCTECALFGKYFARWYGLRHFIWILGQDAAKGNRFVRWIRPKADELLAMSDFLARCFEENYGIRPARIIPNGVDKNLFAPAPNDRDIDLMGVGSLIPLKQYELFVGIAKSLRPAFPGLKAVICGNGPERTKIETLIAAESLTDTITLKGELPHQEVLRLMQRARVFLHPSSFEGFPTACLEALYAGAHVISFVSPMQAWINHWHVVDSVEEMAEKSLEILQDPDADHHSVAPFLMKESASLVLQLYRSNPSEIL